MQGDRLEATRESRLACRQSVLHQAIRLLRRPQVPKHDDQGCRQGAVARLAYGQGARQRVHAQTAREVPSRQAEGHRCRRDLSEEGPRVPHHCQRS